MFNTPFFQLNQMNPQQQSISPQATVAINGPKIRQLRTEQDLTQLYVATECEVAVETVSRWELSSPNIKLANATKLADLFGVSLEKITSRV
ncbi:MAG: XRE family transcriptional regulator, partial [Candidatus Electrothrix sp. AR4]|nr:XRE family transcriptional regulator [Candidatus Electrothrix sp. AR4]